MAEKTGVTDCEALCVVMGVAPAPPSGPISVSELHLEPPGSLDPRTPGTRDQVQQLDLQQRWCRWGGRGWDGAGGGLARAGPPGRMASQSSILPAWVPSASRPTGRGEEPRNTGKGAEGSVQRPSSEAAAGKSGSPCVMSPRREASHK